MAGTFWPTPRKTRAFLTAMLQGDRVTTIDAMMRFNLQTPNARASEMRKLGWPIRSLLVPHPVLAGERIVAYVLDGHFRGWWITQPEGTHPSLYPGNDGRGKFKISGNTPEKA